MTTSIQQFNVELYQEHLDEAGFLYGQRLAYAHDPEVNWPGLLEWEQRFEAHIDALVLGGDTALEVCRAAAASGDAGELHAALCVFCRQDHQDDVVRVLDGLEPADEELSGAAAGALIHEAPTGWREAFVRLLASDRPQLTPVMARVIGFRRFAFEAELRTKLEARPSSGLAELAWALGRVGGTPAVPALRPLLEDDDARVREAASLALMRLGDEQPIRHALQASDERWARQVLAIGGPSRSVPLLLEGVGRKPDGGSVLALGLLGDLAAVPLLLGWLADEALGEPAAVALNTITGAQLFAPVFIADEIDPEELTDEERAAYERDGTVPMRDGRPYGNWERRPARDPATWQAWLAEHKSRFSRDRRWRMGLPYGPAALFECLRAPTTPNRVRAATAEELVVRYRLDVPFEVDLPVGHQVRFLDRIGRWAAAQSGSFDEGRWYFGGRVQR